MDGGLPWVTVVIVNFNGGSLVQDAVDSLAGQTDPDFEVLIVDNASTDGSADRLRLPDQRFRLIRSMTNLGFAAGNNLAAWQARGQWLATCNPDVRASAQWLEILRQATRRHPGVTLFGSTQLSETPGRVDGFGDCLSVVGIPWRGGYGHSTAILPDRDFPVFAPCAAAALYHLETFRTLGGFDEAFFCYIEDVDLGLRFRLYGQRCLQIRAAEVVHLGSAITGARSRFTVYHSYRNRVWMVAKSMPGLLVLVVLPVHVVFALALMVYSGVRGKGIDGAFAGLLAGLKGLPRLRAARAAVQKQRRIGGMAILRLMCWNLPAMMRRSIVSVGKAGDRHP